MGQELTCRLRLGTRSLTGKAYLESGHILFRGEERIRIDLKDLRDVKADNGILTLHYEGGPALLELGASAAKWEKKILHPPTRAAKLGIEPGQTVRVIGEFEPDFLDEISGLQPATAHAGLIFYLAPRRESLDQLPQLAAGLSPAGSLWVIYPKGVKEIREIEVLQAGRAAGLKDVKVASFSPTHTALRFMIPRSGR